MTLWLNLRTTAFLSIYPGSQNENGSTSSSGESTVDEVSGSSPSPWGPIFGNILMVGSMFCFASRMLAKKPQLQVYQPILVNAWIHSIAAIVSVGVACIFAIFGFMDLSARDFLMLHSSDALFALAYSSLLATGFAYTVITWATKYQSATLVTSYTGLNPVCTALLAYLVRGFGIDGFQVR